MSPIIDVINDDTFQYLKCSEYTYGGLTSQGLMFNWISVPDREHKRRNNDISLALRQFKFQIYNTD